MKLTRKQEVQKPSKSQVPIVINPECIATYGKYVNKTIGWIKDNDKSYYDWCHTSGLLGTWTLEGIKTGTKARTSKYQPLRTHNGNIWLMLYEVEEKGSSWKVIEDYEYNKNK